MEYLKEVLDDIFGAQSSHEKDLIVEAVNKDNKEGQKVTGRVAELLPMFNEVFSKKSRVMPAKVITKYKTLLKVYSIDDIKKAFINAKNDEYHTETGYKHLTLEYFSRDVMMDKWVSFNPSQKTIFQMPKMNLKR